MFFKSSIGITSSLLIFGSTKSSKNLGHKIAFGLIILSQQSQTILRWFAAAHPCLLFFIRMGLETIVRQGFQKILGHTHCPKMDLQVYLRGVKVR